MEGRREERRKPFLLHTLPFPTIYYTFTFSIYIYYIFSHLTWIIYIHLTFLPLSHYLTTLETSCLFSKNMLLVYFYIDIYTSLFFISPLTHSCLPHLPYLDRQGLLTSSHLTSLLTIYTNSHYIPIIFWEEPPPSSSLFPGGSLSGRPHRQVTEGEEEGEGEEKGAGEARRAGTLGQGENNLTFLLLISPSLHLPISHFP